MKNYNIKFWFIGAIFALIIGASTEYFVSHTHYENVVPVTFSQKLQSQRDDLKAILNEVTFKIKKNGLNKFLPSAFNTYTSELAGSGLFVIVYNNKDIVYWSDNSFIVSNWQFFGDSLQPVSFINNAWVITEQKTIDSINIVGFVLIKNEFPIENNYLKNTFNPKLGLEGDFAISKIPQQSAFQITDNKGNFLFSLISKNSFQINESYVWLPNIFYLLAVFLLFLGLSKFFKSIKGISKNNTNRHAEFIRHAELVSASPNINEMAGQARHDDKQVRNDVTVFRGALNFNYYNIFLFVTSITIFIIRALMMHYNFPHVIYSFNLFNPVDYASSTIFPSLGDVLIDSVLFFYIAYLFYKYFNINHISHSLKKVFVLISGILFCSFLSFANVLIFKSLILDSTIPFQIYNILETNYNTFIAFIIFTLLVVTEFLVFSKTILILKQWYSLKILLVTFIISELLFFIPLFIVNENNEYYSLIFNVLIFVTFVIRHYLSKKLNFYYTAFFILITALYFTSFTLHFEHAKSINTRKVISVGLSNERDLVAETLLDDLQKKISSDLIISELAQNSPDKRYELLQYLRENYFHGFWTKYDIQTTICTSFDNLKITETDELYGCFEYFDEIIKKQSVQIPNTDFYFVDKNNGRISYLGILELKNKSIDSINTRIFIELDSRLLNQALGYPELLLDKKVNDANIEKKYSYAKYRNGKLLTRNGDYDYRLSINANKNLNNEFFVNTINGYEHLFYKPDKSTLIVLSIQATNLYDVIITFSYILVFLFILYIVELLIKNFRNAFKLNFNLNIRSRILISFISVLILSFILIGTVTVYYIINKYEKKNYDNISEKMQSILIELNNEISNQNELVPEQSDTVTSLLIKYSNVFYSDINLYNKNGTLYASSRPEVFKKGFVGDLMSPEAFYNITYQQKPEIVLQEHIGNLQYLSAYVPYYNSNGKVIAYLNLPFFTRQNALTNEISTFVTTLINIYLILILLAMLVTIFITNGLTHPIILLQRKFREIELGKKNEPLIYKRNDEIGSLVNEYNKMLEELSKSAELLARSERETAWREMAKQIAHEIKNPLTPMKLSVQHLLRSYKAQTPGWENLVDKMSKTLIEQIDTLSAIASEFSMFARLPSPVVETFNIVEKIKSIIELYEQSENVHIVFNNHNLDEIIVKADKEQILRILTNLIKNAIQAIPPDKEGIVTIETFINNSKAIIKITDNGTGISDEIKSKLFIPNFTTKSSGMGLGLTMVKNMVEGMDGSINYETQLGVGTTFIIELPYIN